MKDKHDRVTNIETEVADQKKLIELHDVSFVYKDLMVIIKASCIT